MAYHMPFEIMALITRLMNVTEILDWTFNPGSTCAGAQKADGFGAHMLKVLVGGETFNINRYWVTKEK